MCAVRGHSNAVTVSIITHCNTSRSSSANLSCNSSPLQCRRKSLWCCSMAHTQGQRGSAAAGLTSSGAGCNSLGCCSVGSGSALRQSRGSWTQSWWASRGRKKRRRRKSLVVSSCCDPWGCRALVILARSREPSRKEDMEDYYENSFLAGHQGDTSLKAHLGSL